MTLHVYITGKTGEVLYSLGCLPALRRATTEEIVWHVGGRYWPAIELASIHSDVVMPTLSGLIDGAFNLSGIETRDGDRHVNLYRTHLWYTSDPASSHPSRMFWEHFMDALALDAGEYELPSFDRLDRGRYVMAFPTANEHSRVRLLEAPPQVWSVIAKRARDEGLIPVMTGLPDDGPLPEAPGWSQKPMELPEVLELLRCTRWAIGLNSGILFTHALVGPYGRTTSMLDPQRMPMYWPQWARSAWRQTQWRPRGSIAQWLEIECAEVLG